MAITLSHDLFVEHSQYYTGCAWPTVYGVGSTPHEALQDAIEMARQESDAYVDAGMMYLETRVAILDALVGYANDEPEEPGELGEIEGWDADGSEVYWHCELTLDGMEGM